MANRNPDFFNWYITTLSKAKIKTIENYYESERIGENADATVYYTHKYEEYEEDDIYPELDGSKDYYEDFDDYESDYDCDTPYNYGHTVINHNINIPPNGFFNNVYDNDLP